MRLKFGVLADDVILAIQAAPLDQLERWAERVLTEKTLDGILERGPAA